MRFSSYPLVRRIFGCCWFSLLWRGLGAWLVGFQRGCSMPWQQTVVRRFCEACLTALRHSPNGKRSDQFIFTWHISPIVSTNDVFAILCLVDGQSLLPEGSGPVMDGPFWQLWAWADGTDGVERPAATACTVLLEASCEPQLRQSFAELSDSVLSGTEHLDQSTGKESAEFLQTQCKEGCHGIGCCL